MDWDVLNKYFDKIFVITLQRASDRQKNIEEELKGLNYEFYIGEDKLAHSIEELENTNVYRKEKAKRFHRYNQHMTLGHICCSWSHLHLFEKMVAENISSALILEDDVVTVTENLPYLQDILSQLPATWELVYLGWEKHEQKQFNSKLKQLVYHVQRSLGFHKWNWMQINNLYPKKFSVNLMKAGFHDCTHAYAITQAAAKKLKELQTPIAFNADSLLSYAITNQLIEAYIAVPKVFNQLSQYAKNQSHSFVTE